MHILVVILVIALIMLFINGMRSARCYACGRDINNGTAWCKECWAEHCKIEAEKEQERQKKLKAEQANRCSRCNCVIPEGWYMCMFCMNERTERKEQAPKPKIEVKAKKIAYTTTWAKAEIKRLGYSACMKTYHPDHGGDHNAMVAINLAREQMKRRVK